MDLDAEVKYLRKQVENLTQHLPMLTSLKKEWDDHVARKAGLLPLDESNAEAEAERQRNDAQAAKRAEDAAAEANRKAGIAPADAKDDESDHGHQGGDPNVSAEDAAIKDAVDTGTRVDDTDQSAS